VDRIALVARNGWAESATRQTRTMRIRSLLALLLPPRLGVVAATLLKPETPFLPGRCAPDRGEASSSARLAGKTTCSVFFPEAMTPGCNAGEGRGLPTVARVPRARVEIVGVSFDDP
jgi:hypothetical protein